MTLSWCTRQRFSKVSNGSALIIVLWSLVLISFLAGQYMDHNRGKAGFAESAWYSLRQKEAVNSMLHLFAADEWPIPDQENREGKWNHFSPNGIDLWIKVDDESKRININTAADNRIRQKILELCGDDFEDEANRITDAILDWRDTDLLVRTNGAEADIYEAKGLDYRPANGPFKLPTEFLLVRGISPGLFWGDPMAVISGEKSGEGATTHSLLEDFTVYSKDIKRISIVVPGKGNSYSFVTVFLERKDTGWDILQLCRSMIEAAGGESPLGQTETDIEIS